MMTEDEARQIGMIAGTADSGCPGCVGSMVERLNKTFPDWRWRATNEHQREQPDWSDDPEDERSVGLVVTVEPRSPGTKA